MPAHKTTKTQELHKVSTYPEVFKYSEENKLVQKADKLNEDAFVLNRMSWNYFKIMILLYKDFLQTSTADNTTFKNKHLLQSNRKCWHKPQFCGQLWQCQKYAVLANGSSISTGTGWFSTGLCLRVANYFFLWGFSSVYSPEANQVWAHPATPSLVSKLRGALSSIYIPIFLEPVGNKLFLSPHLFSKCICNWLADSKFLKCQEHRCTHAQHNCLRLVLKEVTKVTKQWRSEIWTIKFNLLCI